MSEAIVIGIWLTTLAIVSHFISEFETKLEENIANQKQDRSARLTELTIYRVFRCLFLGIAGVSVAVMLSKPLGLVS